jgi:hypothetical protein
LECSAIIIIYISIIIISIIVITITIIIITTTISITIVNNADLCIAITAIIAADILIRFAIVIAGANTAAVTSQLLHSYSTVTSQLLHSYFMWNLRQEYDYCDNSNNINAFIMISSISV